MHQLSEGVSIAGGAETGASEVAAAGSAFGAWTVPARARAIATAFSKSVAPQRPNPTGFSALMFGEFQWDRSRIALIVGFVVPRSFEICASESSG
jgi:hypothetical protein